MPAIQVSGDRPGVGKTSLAAALLLGTASQGRSPAYHKPFTTSQGRRPRRCLCVATPAARTRCHFPDSAARGRRTGTRRVPLRSTVINGRSFSTDADPVIVEGPDLASPSGQAWRLPGLTAEALDCRIVLVVGFSNRMSVPALVADLGHMRDRLAGVVVNGVTAYRGRETSQGFVAGLRGGGDSSAGRDSRRPRHAGSNG